MTDPIADMLTRIRNASLVRKAELVLPMSKLKLEIAKILVKEGYLAKAEVVKIESAKNQGAGFDELRLVLRYINGRPKISSLKRISTPGRRLYVNKDHLPRVLNSLGVAVLSTSSGLMTNREAWKKQVGGEVLFEIY